MRNFIGLSSAFFKPHLLIFLYLRTFTVSLAANTQPLLSSLPSPISIDFWRRVPLPPSAAAAPASKNKTRQPRPVPLTHAEVTKRHSDLQPVLRGVSGSTVSSLNSAPVSNQGSSGDSNSNNCGDGDSNARRGAFKLKPMMCGIMGPSGAGKTSLLDCLVRWCAYTHMRTCR